MLMFLKVFDTFIRSDYKDGVGGEKVKLDEFRIYALDKEVYQVSESNWNNVISKEAGLIMLAAFEIDLAAVGFCPSCQVLIQNFRPNGLNLWYVCTLPRKTCAKYLTFLAPLAAKLVSFMTCPKI